MALPPRKQVQSQGEEDEDEEVPMDVSFIQGFADKIQREPQELSGTLQVARPIISIPKRGEKDFEPLAETVRLQEMMLQNSRQSLFDALQGVRGVASKSLSHAIVTPASPFPRLLISRGHVLDSLGITTRHTDRQGKLVSRVELLPEEALYLVERGSLQIWNGREPSDESEDAAGIGKWCDEEFGVKGAVELSVLEVFGTYMGREGLTWSRYQAYASLKRLGYTVQRTRRFIPRRLLNSAEARPSLNVFQRTWRLLCRAGQQLRVPIVTLISCMRSVLDVPRVILCHVLRPTLWDTALSGWSGQTYTSMFAALRLVPAGHSNAVPAIPVLMDNDPSIYHSLVNNPYLPFFHVWKPVTPWSKAKWDRGSASGLAQQPPDYTVAAIDTPLPTLQQLAEIFTELFDEPKGPPRRLGPQYENRRPHPIATTSETHYPWYRRILPRSLLAQSAQTPIVNPVAALRNGDRALTVAVNDSGNTGWVRFGRSGFADFTMV